MGDQRHRRGHVGAVQFLEPLTTGLGPTNMAVYSLNTPNGGPPGGTTAVMIMHATSGGSMGQYEIYDIGGNAILTAYSLALLGPEMTASGLGSFQAGDSDDMLLRNSSTGAFDAYYISGNSITGTALVGTVGTQLEFRRDWRL